MAVEQLSALGIDKNSVAYRVAVGRLHPAHRGVYAVGRPDDSELGAFMAAVLAIGDGAALGFESATALWGFLRAGAREVHVCVARRLKPRDGIRPHYAPDLLPAEVTFRKGIPVTTPARTLLDISRTLPRRQARRAVNEALVQRKVTVPLLYRHAAGPRGARLRALLADAAPTRSELEDVAVEFLKRNGFPRPETNVRVAGFEVDVLLPGRLVVELDSRFHDNPLSRADDARKQLALEGAGYRVERLRWAEITTKEAAAAARLCAPPTSLAA